jgi:S-DNA-T family DNA segregation ATPase FtsK/SpoIIIE
MANAAARPKPKLTTVIATGLRDVWEAGAALRLRGAVCSVSGAIIMASLATYNAADPSWDVAASNVARNAMGGLGADIADVALQTLGLAAWIGALLMVAAGVRRAGAADPHSERLDQRLRGFVAAGGVLMLAAVLAAPLPPASWPLASGLGGWLGEMVLGALANLVGRTDLPAPRTVSATLFAPACLLALAYGAGLRWSDLHDFAVWLIGRGGEAASSAKVAAAKPAKPGAVGGVAIAGRRTGTDEAPETEGPSGAVSAKTDRPAKPPRGSPRTAKPNPLDMIDSVDASAMPLVAALEDPPFDPDDPALVEGDEIDAFPENQHRRQAPPVVQTQVRGGAKGPKLSDRELRENQKAFDFAAEGGFRLPELAMLTKPQPRASTIDEEALRQNARMLETVLAEFGVKGQIDQIRPGPVVTLYELVPAAGVKSSRVISLSDDIARSMSARACRVSVVQGRNAIGIELPNASRETVYLRDLLSSADYEKSSANLPMALGETIGGDPYFADLSKMPHLLIAGTTGSGKSVGVNAMILSILYRLSPEQCRFIMIDPKMLELSVYDGIPHLLAPVVTDPKKAIVALKWTVREMENRYRLMSKIGVRNVGSYNEKAREAAARGEHFERTVQTGFDDSGRPIYESETLNPEPMPYLVVVIDEVADLMMVAGKDIEGAVQRLAQMARAAGIHLIMATQRPSVDVITGTIKANFPTRISFQVTSKIDARTILGEQGAEQLLGQGDMLYMAGGGRVTRLHGPFVSDQEVEDVARFLRDQGTPNYLEEVTAAPPDEDDGEGGGYGGEDGGGNDLYDQAVAVVTRDKKASTSYVQRRLQIGYNRAASLIERMEREGVVSPANHAGKREILAPPPPPM